MKIVIVRIRNYVIGDYFNGFVYWDISEQGGNIKCSHYCVIRIYAAIQKFLNKGKRILDDKRAGGDGVKRGIKNLPML